MMKTDLRNDYDEKVEVKGGFLYRKGVIIQAWWRCKRWTWVWPCLKVAVENFQAMTERF